MGTNRCFTRHPKYIARADARVGQTCARGVGHADQRRPHRAVAAPICTGTFPAGSDTPA